MPNRTIEHLADLSLQVVTISMNAVSQTDIEAAASILDYIADCTAGTLAARLEQIRALAEGIHKRAYAAEAYAFASAANEILHKVAAIEDGLGVEP